MLGVFMFFYVDVKRKILETLDNKVYLHLKVTSGFETLRFIAI